MAVLLIIDVQAGFVNETTRHIPVLISTAIYPLEEAASVALSL